MPQQQLLAVTIYVHLRAYDSFFYTKDERRSILRAAYKAFYA